MNNLKGIVSFTRAVELGSFSAAARLLGLSPAAVSKGVQRLEAELGIRLLHRSTRELSLTDAGRLYYGECRQALETLEAAGAAVAQRRERPAGRLRAGLPTTFSRHCVMPLVPEFLARYPDIRLELILDDHVVDPVREGVDVGIRGGFFLDSTLVARPLAPQLRLLCASPTYLRAHGVPVCPNDLVRHRCLQFRYISSGRPHPWEFVVDGERVSHELDCPLVVNDSECLADAAVAGTGIAQLPYYLAQPHLAAGRLSQVLAEWTPAPDPKDAYFIYYPHRRFLDPKVRVFVDFMVEHLPPLLATRRLDRPAEPTAGLDGLPLAAHTSG